MNDLTKNYMDTLTVLDTVIEYLEGDGDKSGLKSYALVYIDKDLNADCDVLAEPYAVGYDLEGNRIVHWYNRELPASYVIAG